MTNCQCKNNSECGPCADRRGAMRDAEAAYSAAWRAARCRSWVPKGLHIGSAEWNAACDAPNPVRDAAERTLAEADAAMEAARAAYYRHATLEVDE